MQYQNYDETWESPIEGLGEEELELRAARHVRELRALRDELLEALEALTNHTLGMYASGGDSVEAIVKAKAAIKRAKGEVSNG